jgi:hypothetical protein
VVEFNKQFWELIEIDFTRMIRLVIEGGCLSLRMNQGLIVMLHKEEMRRKLINWRPITLLNVLYKIYAKALQLRL